MDYIEYSVQHWVRGQSKDLVRMMMMMIEERMKQVHH
jgi:hypothetical protein